MVGGRGRRRGGKGEGGLQARLHDIETSLDLTIGQLEAVLAHTQQVAVSGAERAEGHLLKVVQVKAEQSCWIGLQNSTEPNVYSNRVNKFFYL